MLRSRQAVVRYFEGISEAIEWVVETVELIDAGSGRYLVHQRGVGTGRTTGISVQGPFDFFQVWHVGRQGTVVRVQEFDERQQAVEAAGLSE